MGIQYELALKIVNEQEQFSDPKNYPEFLVSSANASLWGFK